MRREALSTGTRHAYSLLLHLKRFIITVATIIIVNLAIVVVLILVLTTIESRFLPCHPQPFRLTYILV